MAKSWTEKYHNGKEPLVAASIRKVSGFPPGSQMLIPTPSQVDDYIWSIPCGETRTTAQMAKDLAASAGADLTCPMCCGLFLRICAEKAYEEFEAGSPSGSITPFWRMISATPQIRKKLSFGSEFVDAMLATDSAEA